MTNEKVVVTKEVAEAIEYLRNQYEVYKDDSFFIEAHAIHHSPHTEASWADCPILNEVSTEVFARAILNGYEVEKSPEEQVREYYDRCRTNSEIAYEQGEYRQSEYLNGQVNGISLTLQTLGIKIEGVNA